MDAAQNNKAKTMILEVDEDAVMGYLVDENDQEIGIIVCEDGKEVEYYYAPEELTSPHAAQNEDKGAGAGAGTNAGANAGADVDTGEGADAGAGTNAGANAGTGADDDEDYDLGITREGVTNLTQDMNAIAKEGAAIAREFKEAYDDILGHIKG